MNSLVVFYFECFKGSHETQTGCKLAMELRLALNFHLLSAGITLITIISSYYLFLVFHIKHLTFNDSFEGIFIGNKILKITYVPHTYAYKQKLTCIHVSIYIYIYRNSFFFFKPRRYYQDNWIGTIL